MSRPPRGPSSYLALALLSLLVISLPLARGGVDAPAVLAEVVLSTLAVVLALWGALEVPVAGVFLAGLLVLQTLQLVPIPSAWHGLSAVASRVFQVSLEPVGLYPAARPFSLDLASSASRLAEGIACLAVYLTAWSYSGSRQRLRLLCAAVGLSGVAIAVVVLGAALFGLGPLLEPHFPFVNRNHLAASTHLGAFACLGLAVHSRGPGRILWLLGFVVVAVVGMLSLSRAGLGAFLFGALLFGVLFARRARERASGRRVALLSLGVAVGVVAGATAYLASDSILARIRTIPDAIEEAKPHLWRAGLDVVRDSPWVGIGRGTFGTVFAAYKADAVAVTYTHVENEWLQSVIDLGLPGGLLLVAGLAWLWLAAARRNASGALHVGLLAATAAVAIHDLADFSLEIPGVAIPFFACLGALGDGTRTFRLRRTWLVGAAATAGVVALVGASFGAVHARRAVEAASIPADEAIAAARADLRWHPADFLPHAVAGAALAAAHRCPEAVPWLERAMLLDPTDATAHRIMGRCLWSAGQPALAGREYRLALAYGEPETLEEIIPRYPVLQELLQAVPDTPEDRFRLGLALLGSHRPEDAAEVFQHLLDEDFDERTVLPLARARLASRDYGRALALARSVIETHPNREAYLLAYYSLIGLDEESSASQVLREGAQAFPGDPEILAVLVQLAIQAHHYVEAKRLGEQIVPRSAPEAASRELLVAHALAAGGRIPEAIQRAEAAAASVPDAAEPLMVLAGLLGAVGRYDAAIDALERAASLPGVDVARCRGQIAELRKAAADHATRATEPGQQ